MTKAIGYTRVSTAEQSESGLGLAAQRAAIEAECQRRGWDLVKVLSDVGVSGKSTKNRPALTEALRLVEAGDAEAIVVSKLDRLSRSLRDFAVLMERARAKRWNLVALDLGVDLSTPSGEFMANVLASAAQWERRVIGARTRDALAVAKANGVRLGRPPEIPAAVERRIVMEREGGLTLAAIAERLMADGVPTAHDGSRWHPSTVITVLRRTYAS